MPKSILISPMIESVSAKYSDKKTAERKSPSVFTINSPLGCHRCALGDAISKSTGSNASPIT